MDSALSLVEVNSLYQNLSAEQRQELLECLLLASTKGGDAMLCVVRELLLCEAAKELTQVLE